MTKGQIMRALKARLRELENTRDKLRDLQDEVEDQYDRSDEAARSLEDCIDRISEVV